MPQPTPTTAYEPLRPARPAPLPARATAIVAVLLAALLLVLFEGAASGAQGEQMNPGVGARRRARGRQAGRLGRRPAAARDAAHDATAWLSPGRGPRRAERLVRGAARRRRGRRVPPVTADAFDPAALGAKPPPRRPLQTLLVTGDSMSTPLDAELARALARARRQGDPRPAPRHRHLQELPRRLGPALARARSASTTPTRWSSSSAPTRASRCRAPAGDEVDCCGATGPRVRQPRARR